jgi:hypothetical protein
MKRGKPTKRVILCSAVWTIAALLTACAPGAGSGASAEADALHALKESLAYDGLGVSFAIPEYDTPQDFNILINGRVESDGFGMSVHYLTEENDRHIWTSGETYTVPMSPTVLIHCTELLLEASVPDSDERTEADLLALFKPQAEALIAKLARGVTIGSTQADVLAAFPEIDPSLQRLKANWYDDETSGLSIYFRYDDNEANPKVIDIITDEIYRRAFEFSIDGILKHFSTKDKTLTIDTVERVTDEKRAEEIGVSEEFGNNGFYIYNPYETARVYTFTDSAVFELLDLDDEGVSNGYKAVSAEEFESWYMPRSAWTYVRIEIQPDVVNRANDAVIRMSEQYVP